MNQKEEGGLLLKIDIKTKKVVITKKKKRCLVGG